MLALCLLQREDWPGAAAEADHAVGAAPDLPFAHYVRARVLHGRGRHEEAEAAVAEAIRLDGQNPDYFWLAGAIQYERRRWAAALSLAEQGLAADPEHAGCVNLRAMALVNLGRRDEAGRAIGAALARDPDNAITHANQGWALLHQGDHRKALEHFREALRLKPELEWARAGIVEALKARNFVYRWMLRYFLWMSRLSSQAQWGIILGGFFGYRLLAVVAEQHQGAAPFARAVMIAYVGFAVMTWLADPLFNLLLRLNRFGRLALSRRQVLTSNFIGGLLLAALVALAAGLIRDETRLLLLALVLGLLMLPVSGAFRVPPGWPRAVMIAACCGLALMGLSAVGLMFLVRGYTNDTPHLLMGVSSLLLTGFTWGILATTIGYNFLRGVRLQK
jgi:tetratricopeptide (TPR) repeat protein